MPKLARINNTEVGLSIINHRQMPTRTREEVTEGKQQHKLVRVKEFNICKTKMLKQLFLGNSQDKVSKRHRLMKRHYPSTNWINGEKISGTPEQVEQDTFGIASNQAVKKPMRQPKLLLWLLICQCHRILLHYALMRQVYIIEFQFAL